MKRRVAVITDTTAGLTADRTRRFGISVVPLTVVMDGEPHAEALDVTSADVVSALRRRASVTTSRPSPGQFLQAYEEAVERGAEHIVSVHISGELSGTCDAARLMARDVDVPVTVVDTGLIGAGLGRSVLAAARVAASGGDAGVVAKAATEQAGAARMLFYVDTLEYLWRGGRIDGANALIGTAFNIKPLLHMDHGKVYPLERPRTRERALARLVDLAADAIPGAATGDVVVDVDVQHCDAPDRAHSVLDAVRSRLPAIGETTVSEAGAVISVHVGLGMVGFALSPVL